jgi:hypothetical protein
MDSSYDSVGICEYRGRDEMTIQAKSRDPVIHLARQALDDEASSCTNVRLNRLRRKLARRSCTP